jgi:hypothetical protein
MSDGRGAGCSLSTIEHSSGKVAPSNGGFPVSSSWRHTPSDHVSVRVSTSRDARICSGLM